MGRQKKYPKPNTTHTHTHKYIGIMTIRIPNANKAMSQKALRWKCRKCVFSTRLAGRPCTPTEWAFRRCSVHVENMFSFADCLEKLFYFGLCVCVSDIVYLSFIKSALHAGSIIVYTIYPYEITINATACEYYICTFRQTTRNLIISILRVSVFRPIVQE